jgi:hypothetical protein
MNNLTTLAHGYLIARAAGSADTYLDLTTAGDYAQKPSTAIDLLSKKYEGETESIVNGICFIITGSTAADKNFIWRLLAWRAAGGPAELVADGTGITGTQAIVKYPHNSEAIGNMYWADTIVVVNKNWPKGVESTDQAGNNSVAKLWVDTCGYRYWLLEIADGASNSVTNTAAYYGYW